MTYELQTTITGIHDNLRLLQSLISRNFILNFLVPSLIGFLSVFIPIEISHSVRIRRIKLIYGFTRTFSPQARKGIPKSVKGLQKTPGMESGQQSPSQNSNVEERDIRYSPSLEFVVTKYIVELDEKIKGKEFTDLRDLNYCGEDDSKIGTVLAKVSCFDLATNRGMLLLSLPFMALVACGFTEMALAAHSLAPNFAVVRHAQTVVCVSDLIPLTIVFLSSYIAAVTMIVRAVALFDLTAITFLRASLQILGGVFTGLLIWTVVEAWIGPETCGVKYRWLIYPVLFAVGFVPDAGTQFLLSSIGSLLQSKATGSNPNPPSSFVAIVSSLSSYLAGILQFMKLTDGRFARSTKSIPLDVIDGIDFFTRYRLEEAGIYEVQNLAVANPILLHVETPFGIYQTIDWVGQAQLCTVVGPQRFLILRQFNIRTVFDLERAVLSLKATSELRQIVGGILLMNTETMQEIERDGKLTFPNMTDPVGLPFASKDYSNWSIQQALKPTDFRTKIIKKPETVQKSVYYKVFPIKLPDSPVEVGQFSIVGEAIQDNTGANIPNIQDYQIFEFKKMQDATIKHLVRLIMDDLHVMRLRQIWESIGRILGGDAATLDDSEDTFLGA